MAQRLTTCTFCGVGCGIYLETEENRITGVYPSMSHPANRGRICVRGWHVHEVASSPDRLRMPLMRRGTGFVEVGWEEALGYIADRLKSIRDRHGPDALAFFNSPRCSNEESYLLQKLARVVVGTNNIDHGTGAYCNNSIQVLDEMIGVPATTNSIGELDLSDVIVVDGVDLGLQLPTVGGVVIRAKLNGAKLIVIDSRRHRVAESADLFLQVHPGTESVLYGAMAKVIYDRGLRDLGFIRAHCREYGAFLARLQEYDLWSAAEECGVSPAQIEEAALIYARARRAALLYSTGMEARSRETIRAIVNLALLCGNIGKEGAGIYALAEQNNLQGVCDMGMLPDRFPGYRPVICDEARARFERLWGARLPSAPGQGAREVFGRNTGLNLMGLWLCRYDPVNTALFGDAAKVLDGMELVVVQHIFLTETARRAHVVLPTTAFGEERVSFTNTERRIQLAEKVLEPVHGLTPAWQQIARVAQLMGADWRYNDSSDVMEEIGAVVPFYSGASYENLARDYGRQWPCTKDRPLGTRFLFGEQGPARRFKFVPVPRATSRRAAMSQEYPFTLVLGHSLYYWHQNVLIRHSETLKREYRILLLDYPNGFVEINPEDAAMLGIKDGAQIRLCSSTGRAVSVARVTKEVRRGTVFVPYFVREVEWQMRGAGTGEQLIPVRIEKVKE